MQMIMNILLIFCCALCGIYCQDGEPQNVTVSETSLNVLLGDDADTVTCSADCTPPCEFQWDTEPVTAGASLTIANAKKSDAREYTCTASNGIGGKMAAFELTVIYGPENVTVSKNNTDVLLGDDSEPIICSADCNPSCNFTWDTTPVTEGNILQIQAAEKKDNGLYTCTASNGHGIGIASVHVTVVYKPENVIVSHSSLEVELGKDTTPVICSADCSPPCMFQWDTNPVRIGASLTITNATKSDDRKHTCTAANHIGEGTASFNLTVVYGPQGVSVSESTLDVLLGDNSKTVTCSADCNPRCDFHWNTGPITHGENLTIIEAQKSDDRAYVCTASNKIFNGIREGNATFNLNVVYGPLSIQINISQNINLIRGESISISCQADCNPHCAYKWNKGGNANILKIDTAGQDDIGVYTCIANNAHGNASTTVNISVNGIPDTPLYLRVIAKTAVSLNVSWDIGWDGGDTQKYFISVTDNFTEVDPSLGEYEIHPLISDSPYRIKLYASNRHGNSPKTYVDENTKALPSSEGLFTVTPMDFYANVLLTFGNADSVTDVEIRCCVAGKDDDSSCNDVKENTNGASYVSVNVTYPEGGDGVYDVMVTMFDGDIVVEELHTDQLEVDSDRSENKCALISISVFTFIFAAVAIVLGLLLFREIRNKSKHQCDHVKCNAGHRNSYDYEIDTKQNSTDIAKSHIDSSELTRPSYYNVKKPKNNKTKAPANAYTTDPGPPSYYNIHKANNDDQEYGVAGEPKGMKSDISHSSGTTLATPNAYSTDPGRPSVKPSYYNVHRANNNSQEYVTAEEPQGQRTEIKSSFLPQHIQNPSEYDNLKYMGDVENFATLEPSSSPMGSASAAKSENPEPNPKPRIFTKPATAQHRTNDYEQLNKDDKDSTPGIYTGVQMK